MVNEDRHRGRKTAAFSLVELVMTIAVLAIIIAVGISTVGNNTDAQRYELTRNQLDALRVAILGDDRVTSQGHRSSFGYVGDRGSLPTNLSDLLNAQAPAYSYDSTYGFGAGWNGPYLGPDFTAQSITNDAWGRALIWAPAASPPTITSYGLDGAAGGTLYSKDIVAQLPTTSWRGTVYGTVLNGTTARSGVTVEIRYPVAGVITATTTSTAANGSFSFSNVPYGVRSLRVTTAPVLGPKLVVVDSAYVEVPLNTLNHRDADVNLSSVCCRLSTSNTDAITTADVTGAGTIYLVPYKGNILPLYNGTTWQNMTLSAAVSVSPPASANRVFDIFAYINGANIALETTNWTNDTSRATALTTQDSIYVRNGALTRRYLGTGRTVAASQIDDRVAKRFLWNYNNRVTRDLRATDATASWVYSTTSWRSANNNTNNRVEIVAGRVEAYLNLLATVMVGNSLSSGVEARVGIGEDQTGGSDASMDGRMDSYPKPEVTQAFLQQYAPEGYHYYQWVERGGGTAKAGGVNNATTWYSNGRGITGSIEN